MNVFVVGFDPAGIRAEDASRPLHALVTEVPALRMLNVRSWQSADGQATAAWLAHEGAAVGGATYVHTDRDRIALFAGRPILWQPDGTADGRSALEPASYLDPTPAWAARLDGRFVAVGYDHRACRIDVVTDPVGSYPVYAAEAGTTRWIGNRPALLAQLLPTERVNAVAIAHFFACGWALGGGSLWADVRRLERGRIHRIGTQSASQPLPGVGDRELPALVGAGLDATEAERVLVEIVRASADWPGRPSVVPLSGGLDSRLVFAAAVASGIAFTSRTIAFPHAPGYPETSDVVIARRIATAHGVPHTVAPVASSDEVRADARRLRLLTNGLVSIGDTGPLRLPDPAAPLELLYSGQGGEISRADYGIGRSTSDELLGQLLQHAVPRWPTPLVNREGFELVRSYTRDWIAVQLELGAKPSQIPDLFYLLERMCNWAAPAQSFYETTQDAISPLWFGKLLPHELALAPSARAASMFHFELLTGLCPDLAGLEFDGGNPPWPTFGRVREARFGRARIVRTKLAREARRRVRASFNRTVELQRERLFVESMAEARRSVTASGDHPAWRYLDRSRVDRLLAADPLRLDPRSRRAVTRLVSVFSAE